MIAPSGALLEVERHRNVFIESAPTGLPSLGPQEAIYASKIYEFNNSFGRTLQKPNLVNVFGTAAEEFQDSVSKINFTFVKSKKPVSEVFVFVFLCSVDHN